MIEMSKNRATKYHAKCVIFVASLGFIFLMIPFTLIFYNPILKLVNDKLRLENGSILFELLASEIEGARIHFYLFNVTNAERFLSGDDTVLKMEEVGPFVYQEYQRNDDLEFDMKAGIMRYTPSHRVELVLAESFGRPEDYFLVLPNIAILSAVQMLNKYPLFIGRLFKVLISGMNFKALVKISAHKYLWGNTDPLLRAVNSVVPGLIYFKSTGLMTRFYDTDAKYRLTLGTSDSERFQVKTVKRFFVNKKMNSQSASENTHSYNNTYEGAIFVRPMTPDTPINIYRHSVCKTLKMRYAGTKQMDYGADAYVYNLDNSTFNGRELCDSKGWCPGGIMNMSPCYYGFPFAITKGHFLDMEPKVFEKISGFKPNRSLHDITLFVDPNVGVTMGASMSVQLNLALGDMSLLTETNRLSDMFLPVAHMILKHPRMREETKSSLRLMYTYGPYIMISAQALGALVGISLLACSIWLLNHQDRNQTLLSSKCSMESEQML